MRLEPTPRPEHVLRVSARLIASSTILQLSADELERTVNQEAIENPALTVDERPICLFCASPLHGPICSICGNFAQSSFPSDSLHNSAFSHETPETLWQPYPLYDADNYGFVEIDSIDELDPLARISTGETLADTLLQQLEALIPPADAPIAEQLVGNLDEHGYLEISVQEIAEYLDFAVERVEYVLSQLQTLEPYGIGARNLSECLRLQLQTLSEQHPPPELTALLIDHYLPLLGHNHWHDLAKKLKVPEQKIREAVQYIRTMLYPYPAQIYRSETRYTRLGAGTAYIRPDVLIRQTATGFEVELIEERRYRFQINTGIDSLFHHTDAFSTPELKRYVNQHSERARCFVDTIHRRWRTLRRIATFVVDYQHSFLEKGIRFLLPLTRAEVATQLQLDEGTVSRATANKYALLPTGQLLPFSDFFDGSLAIKDILRELIVSENPRHRLSDDELTRVLNAQGLAIARRTVAKYREEMGIGSSRERS